MRDGSLRCLDPRDEAMPVVPVPQPGDSFSRGQPGIAEGEGRVGPPGKPVAGPQHPLTEDPCAQGAPPRGHDALEVVDGHGLGRRRRYDATGRDLRHSNLEHAAVAASYCEGVSGGDEDDPDDLRDAGVGLHPEADGVANPHASDTRYWWPTGRRPSP